MYSLITLSLLVSTMLCNIIKEHEAYQSLADPYEYTSPYELIDLGIDELCSSYPSLRSSTDDELITFKKEFMAFLAEKPEVQDEVLTGFPDNYRVLWSKMKELRKISNEEFESLTDDEKRFIESPTGLILHKLGIQSALKVIASRKDDYKKRKLNKEQIAKEVADRQLAIFHSWHGEEIANENEERRELDEL